MRRAAFALLLAACTRHVAKTEPTVAPAKDDPTFHCFWISFPSGASGWPCLRDARECEDGRANTAANGWAVSEHCARQPVAYCFSDATGETCDATADSCTLTRSVVAGYRSPCYDVHASWPARAAEGQRPFHCGAITSPRGEQRHVCGRDQDDCESLMDRYASDWDISACKPQASAFCFVSGNHEVCAGDQPSCELFLASSGAPGDACMEVRAN